MIQKTGICVERRINAFNGKIYLCVFELVLLLSEQQGIGHDSMTVFPLDEGMQHEAIAIPKAQWRLIKAQLV